MNPDLRDLTFPGWPALFASIAVCVLVQIAIVGYAFAHGLDDFVLLFAALAFVASLGSFLALRALFARAGVPVERRAPLEGLPPVELTGTRVRLVPLRRAHLGALCAVGLDPEIWRFTAGHVETAAGMRAYIDRALARQACGDALPFAIEDRATGTIIGCTRFGAIALAHRRVEIGWTWLGRDWQGAGHNVEAKYLLLRHAFETFGFRRVEFKTDARNERSRRAILGLGATEEGTMRKHMVTSRGESRDTVWFGIVDDDWPRVRAHLEARLA